MVLHTVRGHWNIRKNSLLLNLHAKWSALLVYSVLYLRKFDFCFAKNRCAHIFSVLSPGYVFIVHSFMFIHDIHTCNDQTNFQCHSVFPLAVCELNVWTTCVVRTWQLFNFAWGPGQKFLEGTWTLNYIAEFI